MKNHSIEPGNIMMLQGLQAKPKLNGEIDQVLLKEANTPA
jgi:hypothetical protein